MKKVISVICLIVILLVGMICLSGCTIKVETTDNSVSASVDKDTTKKVDGIIDWIKERMSRVFSTSNTDSKETENKQINSKESQRV